MAVSEPEHAASAGPEGSGTETSRQIRGSTLLVGGRFAAMLVNLVTQVLIVRHLTQSDYGAFAYAYSFLFTARILVSLGHTRTITRFLSIYDERREYGRLFGTLVMEVALTCVIGVVLFGGILVSQGWIAGTLVDDPTAVAVLAILILLAPVEALDDLLEGTCAVLASPRAIFFRKYVLGPGLKLGVVLTLVLTGAGVAFLAAGYVLAGLVGIAIYGVTVVRLLGREGLLRHFRWDSLEFPFREITRFSFPLLTTEAVTVSMNTVSVALLGGFTGVAAVAAYRAIFPAARLNHFVLHSFTVLFMPLASRLYARGDHAAVRDAYWRTAAWLTVFTFPVFALTVPLASPLTVTLFGERYADSATYLALLSVGYYANAAFGFNALLLQVYGRLRYLVVVNVGAALVNVALSFALIPAFGALGVAIANASTLLLQNAANQLGLRKAVGVGFFSWRYVRAYAVVALAGASLWGVQLLLNPPFAAGLALAAAVSLGVLVLNRSLLQIGETFPELERIPLLGKLVR